MGSLRSASDCTGLSLNGIILGEPTFTDAVANLDAVPLLFVWDDPRLPNGVIQDNGHIAPDDPEDI